MMSDLISIIIPVYNAEKTLNRCVDSILSQSYTELEIILVNDGSTDYSAIICNDYRNQDQRVKVINKENAGPSSARNAGINMAKGRYLGFADADDFLERDMYSWLYSQIKRNNAQIAACGWIQHDDGDMQAKGFSPSRDLFDGKTAMYYVLKGGYFDGYLWNKLFDADIFKSISLNNEFLDEGIHVCEDLYLCCQLFKICDRVFYNPKPLYNYVIHPDSIMRAYKSANMETQMIAMQRIIDLVKNYDKKVLHISKFKYTQTALINLVNSHRNRDYDTKRKMRTESCRYILPSLLFNKIGLKAKFRLLIMFIAPVKSIGFWHLLKNLFGLNDWTKPNDK